MFFLRRLQSVTIQNYSGYLVVIKTRNGKELLSICISPFPGKYKIFALLSASLCWRFFWGVIMTGFIGITAPMWRSPGFSSWQDLSLTEAQVTWSTRDGDRHGRDPRDFFFISTRLPNYRGLALVELVVDGIWLQYPKAEAQVEKKMLRWDIELGCSWFSFVFVRCFSRDSQYMIGISEVYRPLSHGMEWRICVSQTHFITLHCHTIPYHAIRYHTYGQIYRYMHTNIRIYSHLYIYIYIYILHFYICTRTHICIHIYMILYIYICVYTYTYVHI